MENRSLIQGSLIILAFVCLLIGMTETMITLLACAMVLEALICLRLIKQMPADSNAEKGDA